MPPQRGTTQRDFLPPLMLVAAGALLAALIAYGWLGTCARLEGDDYVWAQGSPGAAMSKTWETYNGWSGCYSCIFLLALLLPISPKVVMVLPAAALGLWLLALLALFRELFRGLPANRTWGPSLLAATATIWATVNGTLSTGYSLYWPDGMIKYTVPQIMLTFAAAWTIAQSRRDRIPGVVVCTLTFLMLFICGGFSEASLAVQTIAVIVALGLSWTSANRSLHRILVVSFAATVASAAAVYLAPGNIVRQGWIGATSPWPTAIVRAWWNAGACTVRFIVWRPAPAFSAFAAGWLVTKWNASSLDGAAAFRQVQHGARVYLPTALVILAASFLPAAFALSDYPPSRAWIVPQFVLVLAVFACGCSCAAAPAEMRILTARSLQVLFYTLLIAAPLWSLFQTVERHADAAWYAKLWDRRDGRLRAYVRAGQLDVVLDPLPEDLGLSRRLSIPKESPDVASFYGLRTSREDKSNQDGVEPFRREWWWTRVAYPQNFQSTIIHRLRGIRSFW